MGRSQHPAPSVAQHRDRRQEHPSTGAAGASRAERGVLETENRAGRHPPAAAHTGRRPPRLPAPHRAPPASMRLLAAALLLLLLALCASRVDGECRKGPLSRSCPILGSSSIT